MTLMTPRIQWTKCGDFAPGQVVGGRSRSSSHFTQYTDNSDCYNNTYRYRTYDGDLPNWLPLKYTTYDDEWPLVNGEEMRLIQAEVALRNGQLGAMAGFINEVRAKYGLDPIETPTTAGALEYPNAEDDGWSILDREKLFTLSAPGPALRRLPALGAPRMDRVELSDPGRNGGQRRPATSEIPTARRLPGLVPSPAGRE